LALVFGTDACFGTGDDFTPVSDETPQSQDIFVVRIITLLAKTAKLGHSVVTSTSSAFLLFFSHT